MNTPVCTASFSNPEIPQLSINQEKNHRYPRYNFRHYRVHLYAFLRQPFSKQLYKMNGDGCVGNFTSNAPICIFYDYDFYIIQNGQFQKSSTSELAHLDIKVQPKCFKLVVCNPCQSCPSNSNFLLVSLWFIFIFWAFSNLSEELFSVFFSVEGALFVAKIST